MVTFEESKNLSTRGKKILYQEREHTYKLTGLVIQLAILVHCRTLGYP